MILIVKNMLTCNDYSMTDTKGIKVLDEEMTKINIQKDSFHGEWNYTIFPTTPQDDTVIL